MRTCRLPHSRTLTQLQRELVVSGQVELTNNGTAFRDKEHVWLVLANALEYAGLPVKDVPHCVLTLAPALIAGIRARMLPLVEFKF